MHGVHRGKFTFILQRKNYWQITNLLVSEEQDPRIDVENVTSSWSVFPLTGLYEVCCKFSMLQFL